MYKYELCLVLKPSLEDDARNQEIEKVKGYIERFGGKVLEPIEEWGKKRLAYEINHIKEGYYYFIPFEGVSNTSNEVESFVRIMENVIRFLIVKKQ